MIAKKICLIGSFAVGKTSLVRRFVESIFSEKYQTTIGVKIDKKIVQIPSQDVQLMIWDMEGRDEFSQHRTSYFRGAAGYFLVIDSTRPETLEVALETQEELQGQLGELPFIALITKRDLTEQRRLDPHRLATMEESGWEILETSAKTGINVERAFQRLAEKILDS